MAQDVLIVDDEEDIRDLISGILEDEGYETRLAHDADSALKAIEARRPGLVFLDIWMQGSRLDGLQLLDAIQERHKGMPVVMISGHGNVETAVSAIRRGAYDYIEKPFKIDRLLLIAQRALETRRLKEQVQDLKVRSGADNNKLVGASAALASVKSALSKCAMTNSRVFFTGPSGTGKGLCARNLHELSHRAAGPFVEVNLAMHSDDDLPEVLFGREVNENGSKSIRAGAFERAHGGTIYLAEVEVLSAGLQSQLLRAVVENKFTRIDGETRVDVDVRIVSSCATNISRLVEEGQFRGDLFHRLAVIPLALPSLRERREDIPPLVAQLAINLQHVHNLKAFEIADDAMAVLQAQDWPGNARQLRNSLERLVILHRDNFPDDGRITAEMLPADIGEVLPSVEEGAESPHLMTLPLREAREVFERQYLVAQIERFGGNISRTAEFVGMERSALHRKLKSLGL
ncbi:nitrogen assimilation response regulator NtrX [Maritalea sp.]|uniref:nitrogen assimilation response regulator NtrX n=1 Tax=Maritalea sp. TaxID=2003361 RepID=UPI003EF9DBF1